MSKGAVLCRPPQPVTMTRDPSLSTAASPTPQQPSPHRHVVVDVWPDATSIATPSPRHRRSGDKQQQHPPLTDLHFLRSCDTCRRRLSPNRDVYIYRGEIGFCSPECRERRIRIDDDEMVNKRYYY